MITFLRRPKLGRGSVRGMTSFLNGIGVPSKGVLHDRQTVPPETSLLVRWGCVGQSHFEGLTLNPVNSIYRVNDKLGFRILCRDSDPNIVPFTIVIPQEWNGMRMIVRPKTHAQGRNLKVISTLEELLQVTNEPAFRSGWYASELIDKVAEYRVYVIQGRVATIAEKTPADPSAIAWNVAQGGRFDVLPRGRWPMNVVEVAVKSWALSGLDFGGVDVIVDRDGKAYQIEINSAPSLPLLSDGSISYRQKCMATVFNYIRQRMDKTVIPIEEYSGWRSVIHPALMEE